MAKKTKHLIEDLLLEAVQSRAAGKIITVGRQRKPRKCVDVAFRYDESSHDSPDVVFMFAGGEEAVQSYCGVFTVLENEP